MVPKCFSVWCCCVLQYSLLHYFGRKLLVTWVTATRICCPSSCHSTPVLLCLAYVSSSSNSSSILQTLMAVRSFPTATSFVCSAIGFSLTKILILCDLTGPISHEENKKCHQLVQSVGFIQRKHFVNNWNTCWMWGVCAGKMCSSLLSSVPGTTMFIMHAVAIANIEQVSWLHLFLEWCTSCFGRSYGTTVFPTFGKNVSAPVSSNVFIAFKWSKLAPAYL